MIDIAVIVCTYNRSDQLPRLFQSLAAQVMPKASFEVLLVDNNSHDDTREVTEAFRKDLDNLRYIFEPNQGLSIARNRGMKETEAPLIVYVDDDAYVETQWLSSLVESFAGNDNIVCVGGPVGLDWQGERPHWVPMRYESLFTCVDHGREQRYLSSWSFLVGANIAFRHAWLMEQGGFSEGLGRKGNSLLSGEEAHIYQKVFETGKMAYYHPGAKVMHRVVQERKSRKWFFRRLFWDGATQPILDVGKKCPRRIYVNGAYHDLRRCLRFTFEAISALAHINRKGFVDAVCRLVQRLGRLYMHMLLAMGKTS